MISAKKNIDTQNQLKVRFFYDTNNNFFNLSRFLIRAGIDAKVIAIISIERGALYRIYDTLRNEDDVDSVELSMLDEIAILENPFGYSKKCVREAIQKLLGNDKSVISVGSGIAPAVFEYAGLDLDITFPTGADVQCAPFYTALKDISWGFGVNIIGSYKNLIKENTNIKKKTDLVKFWELLLVVKPILHYFNMLKNLPRLQLQGIEKSIIALQDPVYLETWENIDNLNIKKIAIPMEDDQIQEQCLKNFGSKNVFKSFAKEIRSNYQYIILSTNKNDNLKGTDILLRGYLEFKKINPTLKSLLIISSRSDLAWASRGVEELFKKSLKNKEIILLPLIPQKELDIFYEISDICFGKINQADAYLNSTISKILAHGKPMLCFINYSYKKKINNVYPYLSVEKEVDICFALNYYKNNRYELERLGLECSDWYRDFVKSSTKDWISLLEYVLTKKSALKTTA